MSRLEVTRYEIVEAIPIHAACLLMTTAKDTFDIDAGQRMMAMVDAAFIFGDLAQKWRNRCRPAPGTVPRSRQDEIDGASIKRKQEI